MNSHMQTVTRAQIDELHAESGVDRPGPNYHGIDGGKLLEHAESQSAGEAGGSKSNPLPGHGAPHTGRSIWLDRAPDTD
jgi:hypothetical protein